MADKKRPKYETFISPKGTFKFPKLTEADTKFKAEGQYSVTLMCDPSGADVQALVDIIDEQAAKTLDRAKDNEKSAAKKKKWMSKFLPYAEGEDQDGEPNGTIEFKFNMTASGKSKATGKPWKRKPGVFDASGKPLPAGIDIWGGTVGYVAFQIVPYSQSIQTGASVKLALEAAQILDLVSRGSKSAEGHGFDTDLEGYAAPDADESDDEDATDDDDDDDDGDEDEGDF